MDAGKTEGPVALAVKAFERLSKNWQATVIVGSCFLSVFLLFGFLLLTGPGGLIPLGVLAMWAFIRLIISL